MKVICPECNFSSEIPEDKIPANAQLATCPKCGIKFQFRELPPVEEQAESGPENVPYEDGSYQTPESTDSHPAYQDHGMQSYGTEEAQHTPEQNQADSLAGEQQYSGEHNRDYSQEQHSYTHENAEADERPHVQDAELHQNYAERTPEDTTEKGDIWQRLDSMRPDNDNEIPAPAKNSDAENEVPFENLEKYGFFPGLFLTIKKILLSPAAFFKDMELTGFIKPLIFFILIVEFSQICSFIWTTAGILAPIDADVTRQIGSSLLSNPTQSPTMLAVMSLIIYPIAMGGLLFPTAAFTHVMLMIFGAGEKGYQATFRVAAYSAAPLVLCVVPIIGDAVGALISIAISIIAYKSIHNTSYMRVVLSIVMPVVLLLVILGFYMNFSQPTI